MKPVIEYLGTYSFVDILSIVFLICTIIVCVEKAMKWIFDMFTKAYNKKKGKEEESTTIENSKAEIKELSAKIDELANLMNKQYLHLEKKIDEQKERLNDFEESSERRYLALLRDRILQGYRFFKRNVMEDGFVHINITDFESMQHLFTQYFECGGNGTVGTLHADFKTWKVDH
jgi:hypothetical protein